MLRRHGRIVGWLFGSPGVPPNSVWYARGYVLPALQRRGWLLAGMREVCELQIQRMGPDSLCMFHTSGENRRCSASSNGASGRMPTGSTRATSPKKCSTLAFRPAARPSRPATAPAPTPPTPPARAA
ncbi:hypothetical protein HK414_06775 [Ramlibacter terrae]|uniref:N-acetyltransferase domain-containing protein n=1 Tax=Ramlibacter terrae TaxID=2732511 RepID=A0ABX6P179_9BURK|nr:hypothetical protein HK414_06775 [Ramlibacter terrae]